MLILLSGCRKEKLPEFVPVKYTVDCGSCDLTYTNSSGSTEQRSMSNSWYYDFTSYPDGFYYISAQNNNASGSVTVRIYFNGKLEKEATSTGAYVIATASL